MKEGDALQAKENRLGMYIGTIPGKHKPKEGATKWF
jgi:hypothetical protein